MKESMVSRFIAGIGLTIFVISAIMLVRVENIPSPDAGVYTIVMFVGAIGLLMLYDK